MVGSIAELSATNDSGVMPFTNTTQEIISPQIIPTKIKTKFAITAAMHKLKLANSAREVVVGGGGLAAISIDSPVEEENGSCTHRGNVINGLIAEDSAAEVCGSVAEADDEAAVDEDIADNLPAQGTEIQPPEILHDRRETTMKVNVSENDE